MNLRTPVDALGAGPVHFSYSGWAFVSIFENCKLTPDPNCFLNYEHPFSFEADSWINQDEKVNIFFFLFFGIVVLIFVSLYRKRGSKRLGLFVS